MKLRFRLIFGLAIMLLLSQVFGAIAAIACVIGPSSVQEKFHDAGAVFVGKVLTITDTRVYDPQRKTECTEHRNHFQIITSWKSVDPTLDSIDVYNQSDCEGPPSDCDVFLANFQAGETYLVFAFIGADGKLRSSVTTFNYTMPVSQSADTIKTLGSGQVPGQPTISIVGMPGTGGTNDFSYLLIVLAFASISSGILLKRLNARKSNL